MNCLCSVCLVLAIMPAALAQSGKNFPVPVRRPEAAKAAAEAADVLEKAKTGSVDELARRASDEAKSLRAKDLADKIRQEPPVKPSFAEQQRQAESGTRLSEAMSQLSPAGKAILAQTAAAPAMRAPVEPVTGTAPLPVKRTATEDKQAGVVKTAPVQKEKDGAPKGEPQHTVIECQGAAYFDSKHGLGVFTDDVVVVHPQFHLTSDVLEVYMKKDKAQEEKAGAPGEAAKGAASPSGKTASDLLAAGASDKPAAAPDKPTQESMESGIETAIAKGRRVVIRKASETGELQVGICRHATYIGATGDIVMRDYPQVQRGQKTVRGTAPNTVLTLKQNGELLTSGPTAVDLVQEEPAKAPPPAASANSKTQGGQQ